MLWLCLNFEMANYLQNLKVWTKLFHEINSMKINVGIAVRLVLTLWKLTFGNRELWSGNQNCEVEIENLELRSLKKEFGIEIWNLYLEKMYFRFNFFKFVQIVNFSSLGDQFRLCKLSFFSRTFVLEIKLVFNKFSGFGNICEKYDYYSITWFVLYTEVLQASF